jgi:hypothetical protein
LFSFFMRKIVFITQYLVIVLVIILKINDAPGVLSLSVISWIIPIIYFLISATISLIKKDKTNAFFNLIGFLLCYCISVKFLFVFHNVLVQILALIAVLFFVKKFELKKIHKSKLWFVLVVFLLNLLLVFIPDRWLCEKIVDDDFRKVYDGTPVTWDMFEKVDSLESGYDADINSMIFYKENFAYNFTPAIAFAVMNKDKSHVAERGDKLLIHEDYHFKITQVSAKKLRLELVKHPFASAQTTKKNIEKYIRALKKTQKRYDDETSHGVNRPKQLFWQKMIDNELKNDR